MSDEPKDEEFYADEGPEVTEGGSEILRHQARERDFEPAAGDSETIQAISDHIEKHVGPIEMVFHEIVSDLVHVDVHWVKATDERPFHVLITSGMSERPMNAPKPEWQYAELCILLPPDWPMERDKWEDENNYWPIRWLKTLARLPHEYNTWLGYGHTVPNGDPPEPFAPNTDFACWLLLPPVSLPQEFSNLRLKDGRLIKFWTMVALYEDEMALKLNVGTPALIEKFSKRGVSDILDPQRKSIYDKSGRKGWFFKR
jgi:hypothetical protein